MSLKALGLRLVPRFTQKKNQKELSDRLRARVMDSLGQLQWDEVDGAFLLRRLGEAERVYVTELPEAQAMSIFQIVKLWVRDAGMDARLHIELNEYEPEPSSMATQERVTLLYVSGVIDDLKNLFIGIQKLGNSPEVLVESHLCSSVSLGELK